MTAPPPLTHSGPSGVAAPHPVSLVPAGRGALGVSWVKASASVTSGHTNRAAVAEKTIGEPNFDLTGAPVASCACKRSSRRSSDQPRCCTDQEPCEVSPPHRHLCEANALRPPAQAPACGLARRQQWPPRSSAALRSANAARHRARACSGRYRPRPRHANCNQRFAARPCGLPRRSAAGAGRATSARSLPWRSAPRSNVAAQ
jgi:hypothetical protein